jgi:hypothetical protein
MMAKNLNVEEVIPAEDKIQEELENVAQARKSISKMAVDKLLSLKPIELYR